MMMTADARRLRGPKYRRSSLNKSIIQKSVDSIMRVSESGQAWLESDLSESESDSDS